jgi:hypothetical protein
LIDRIDEGECVFVTDDWAGFYRLLPEDRHFPGKDVTFPLKLLTAIFITALLGLFQELKPQAEVSRWFMLA